MSYGKAIVTVDMGDMYLLVRNGENGYLANTEEEMETCILNIDQATAKRMGERSLQIAKEYTWKDTAKAYMSLIERSLGKWPG
jgi:glycosyltransferase involved in cell wall biosynthesis